MRGRGTSRSSPRRPSRTARTLPRSLLSPKPVPQPCLRSARGSESDPLTSPSPLQGTSTSPPPRGLPENCPSREAPRPPSQQARGMPSRPGNTLTPAPRRSSGLPWRHRPPALRAAFPPPSAAGHPLRPPSRSSTGALSVLSTLPPATAARQRGGEGRPAPTPPRLHPAEPPPPSGASAGRLPRYSRWRTLPHPQPTARHVRRAPATAAAAAAERVRCAQPSLRGSAPARGFVPRGAGRGRAAAGRGGQRAGPALLLPPGPEGGSACGAPPPRSGAAASPQGEGENLLAVAPDGPATARQVSGGGGEGGRAGQGTAARGRTVPARFRPQRP